MNTRDSISDSSLSEVRREFKGERGDLIPVLQRVQDIFGYLRPETIRSVSRWLKISENEIFGVATFYAQFRFQPPGRHTLKICHGTACHVNGAESLDTTLQMELGIGAGQTTADGEFSLEKVACLGCCSLAPVVMLDAEVHGRLTGDKLKKVVRKVKE